MLYWQRIFFFFFLLKCTPSDMNDKIPHCFRSWLDAKDCDWVQLSFSDVIDIWLRNLTFNPLYSIAWRSHGTVTLNRNCDANWAKSTEIYGSAYLAGPYIWIHINLLRFKTGFKYVPNAGFQDFLQYFKIVHKTYSRAGFRFLRYVFKIISKGCLYGVESVIP